jgi:hypothetical protein
VRLAVPVVVWANAVNPIPKSGGSPMSIVVRFSPASMTPEMYDKAFRMVEEAGETLPPDGCDYHVCFGSDSDLRVSEIWDSREQFEAFGERLMPMLSEAGIGFSAEPEVYEVHNILKR